MKKLVITGLAQETDFDNPVQPHSVLVINGGELRIPIDESAVERVLAYVLKGHVGDQDEVFEKTSNGQHEETDLLPAQDDEEQAESEPEAEEEELQADDSEEVVDQESGIAQL